MLRACCIRHLASCMIHPQAQLSSQQRVLALIAAEGDAAGGAAQEDASQIVALMERAAAARQERSHDATSLTNELCA